MYRLYLFKTILTHGWTLLIFLGAVFSLTPNDTFYKNETILASNEITEEHPANLSTFKHKGKLHSRITDH